MRPDEFDLLTALAKRGRTGELADSIGAKLGIHPKRTEYLLGKWASKGWWDYGVSLRTGWLTEAGLAAARKE